MLAWLRLPFESVRSLTEMGGDVLYGLLFVTFVMWSLLIERFWYSVRIHPRHMQWVTDYWKSRRDRASWHAQQVRKLLLSDASERANRSLSMIRTLVKLCPLFGLLGTVTGMIEIFDVMAVAGTGNVRAMASGVSKATIPTMVGMATALSGLFFIARLEERTKQRDQMLNEALTLAVES